MKKQRGGETLGVRPGIISGAVKPNGNRRAGSEAF